MSLTVDFCSSDSARNSSLNPQFQEIAASIELPKSIIEWSLPIIKKEYEKEISSRTDILTNQRKQYDECLTKINNLIDLCADGAITQDDLKRRREVLEAEKERLHALKSETNDSVGSWLDRVEEAMSLAVIAKEKFDKSDDNGKKSIIGKFCSNLSLKDKEVTVTHKKVYDKLAQLSQMLSDLDLVVRTAGNRMVKRENSPSYGEFLELHGMRESNSRPGFWRPMLYHLTNPAYFS